jgi:hypothetical protein
VLGEIHTDVPIVWEGNGGGTGNRTGEHEHSYATDAPARGEDTDGAEMRQTHYTLHTYTHTTYIHTHHITSQKDEYECTLSECASGRRTPCCRP